ncbi:winged helix-turn-helix domain-containing protein [Paraglaciecola arctica]|uniref:winged helix-turn-helix domain-containing protein n=1 Tax=Paraglaciecola arctica TaxID=1128911 RepID=UPI001C07671D|nr:crosslink repair DNA glycosylase YcaQ family protein [Paraglaciecola arctica]MBU3001773.1 winged helix DNA-binding domain-containing protein [Paraglaciecola arctica]
MAKCCLGNFVILPLIELTQKQACKLALVSQGLHKNNPFGQGLTGVTATLKQLSYVQIDSISVIQRAHHHCLWSRVKNYQPEFLEQLIAQQQIFEYWSHAAAYLPMQDYRFSLPKKRAVASGEKHWRDKNPIAEKRVLQRIKQEGPLRAADFEHKGNHKSSGWWDWKPDKVALEQLFIEGELMVVKRLGFQKVYDLTERVLPSSIDTTVPTVREYERYLIERYLCAHGFASAQQISYLRKGMRSQLTETCQQMLENKELQPITVGGKAYYALPNATDLLKHSISRDQVHILSPFDNLVIQRKRLSDIFGFDYQIECYVPAHKRQYGYFSLPLLWGAQFVGRMDAKVDRKTQVLYIQNLHLETNKTEKFIEVLKPVLLSFMEFNSANQIQVRQVTSQVYLQGNTIADVKKRLQAF